MADSILLRSSLQEVLPAGYQNGDSSRLLRAALLKRFQIRGMCIPLHDRRPARRLNKLRILAVYLIGGHPCGGCPGMLGDLPAVHPRQSGQQAPVPLQNSAWVL